MATITGVIRKGIVQALYDDALRPYVAAIGGECVTRRASYVEPSDADGDYWLVDFSPIKGRRHYVDNNGEPFASREAALAFEKEYLAARMAVDCVL